jgi:hypothetical protein
MIRSPKSMRVLKFVLGLALASLAIVLIWTLTHYENFSYGILVRDFTLCQADTIDGKPKPLDTLVLTPTTVIYACGYLEANAFAGQVCFDSYLNKGTETIYSLESYYCLPAHSQYFTLPIKAEALRIPGQYRLYIYEVYSRLWLKSVAFEISSSSK